MRRRDRRAVLVVLGAILALAVFAHPGENTGPGAAAAPSTVAPVAGSYTPQTWAVAFLQNISEPRTSCNVAAVVAWEQAEGGAWNNNASFNPLNTTYDDNGAWEGTGQITATINRDNVRAYDSWATGLQANAAVIDNGMYGGILSALAAGNNAQAVASQVAASHWGTSWFSASC